MDELYTDGSFTQTASAWLDDMGGIEAVIGRPLFGAPTADLIESIMLENGLTRV